MSSVVIDPRPSEQIAEDNDLDLEDGYCAAVEAGILWLDQKVGLHWVHRVNLSTFDIGSPCECVLGQVYRYEASATASNGYGWALHSDDGPMRHIQLGRAWEDEPTPMDDIIEAALVATAWPFSGGSAAQELWVTRLGDLQLERAAVAPD